MALPPAAPAGRPRTLALTSTPARALPAARVAPRRWVPIAARLWRPPSAQPALQVDAETGDQHLRSRLQSLLRAQQGARARQGKEADGPLGGLRPFTEIIRGGGPRDLVAQTAGTPDLEGTGGSTPRGEGETERTARGEATVGQAARAPTAPSPQPQALARAPLTPPPLADRAALLATSVAAPFTAESDAQRAGAAPLTPASLTPTSLTPAPLTPTSLTPASLTPASLTPSPRTHAAFPAGAAAGSLLASSRNPPNPDVGPVPGRGTALAPGKLEGPGGVSSAGFGRGRVGAGDDDGRHSAFERYRRHVQRKVERSMLFDRERDLGGDQGFVLVRYVIERDGRLGEVVLLRPSGFPEFDADALRALRRASPFLPLPDSLARQRLVVEGMLKYNNPVVR